jgi:hypothetical protein
MNPDFASMIKCLNEFNFPSIFKIMKLGTLSYLMLPYFGRTGG